MKTKEIAIKDGRMEDTICNMIASLQKKVDDLERDNKFQSMKIKVLEKALEDRLDIVENSTASLNKGFNDITASINHLAAMLTTTTTTTTLDDDNAFADVKLKMDKVKKGKIFILPSQFSEYQKQSEFLIESLSGGFTVKKGKWTKGVLQWVLTPTAKEKEKGYPDKWRIGLYLQPSQWSIDKFNYDDPDEWMDEWGFDIYEYADCNGIELS